MVRGKIVIEGYKIRTHIALENGKKNGKNRRDRIVKDRIQSIKHRKQIVFKNGINY